MSILLLHVCGKYLAGMLRMNGMRRTQSKYKPFALSITRILIKCVFDLSRKT